MRIQTTEYSTISAPDGKFQLEIPESIKSPVKLTAWAKGYYISGPVEASPGTNKVSIFLKRHERWDNHEYKWLPSYQSKGSGENQGCAECHLKGEKGSGPLLPVDEWLKDANSQSAKNTIFLTLHSGKEVSGRRSQSTRYRYDKDLKLVPLPPNPDEPDYGPGYRLDNPNFTGNCGSCHVPLTAVNAPLNTYPDSVQGVDAEGANCDFCHKIYDVNLDPVTGLPFQDMPGVLSYEFRRPFDGHQFFSGPLGRHRPRRRYIFKYTEEKGTGISPTAANWRPVNIMMDTRLAAFESDIGEFIFSSPLTGDVRVEAALIYRRAFKKLLEQKGIKEPDIIMESANVLVSKK